MLSLLLFLAAPVLVPFESHSVLTVEEIVVTAERVPHAVRDVAASVSVVTSEEVARSGARTATDALAGLAGVFVQRTGQFGRTDIDIRGVGDRGCRVQVLVDGRPEKMSLFGCTVTHTLPVNNIERIEVVRGPLSVLYGSDALGGVVNIVTRRATRPLELGARFDYGSFNTWHGQVSAGLARGRFHALLSADRALSDGHLPNSQYDGTDLSLRAGYDFAPGFKLDFTGKYFGGTKHEPKRSTDPETLVATGWNRYDRAGLDLSATFTVAQLDGTARLWRTFGEHEFDPKDGWHSTDYTNGALLHLHRRFDFGNLVQAGIEARALGGTRIVNDSTRPSWTRSDWAVFAQDEQELGPVAVNAGVRYNRDNIAGGILAPKAGLVVRPLAHTALRASVNRGFRYAPFNYTHIFPPANESLRPEKSWQYEIGASQRIITGLSADIAAFILEGTDLIEAAPNPSPPPMMKFVNRGSFAFKGLEAGLELKRRPLRGRAALTLLDVGANTRARPGFKLDAALGADWRDFSADIDFNYTGRYFAADSSRQPIPDYWTAGARLGWKPLAWGGLFVVVDNIFNREYDTFADLPGAGAGLYRMPGRSFTVGLDLALPRD